MWRKILTVSLIFAALAPAQISEPLTSDAERTRWFREAKFGIFVHWGVYSVVGRHEWARHRFQIPQPEYDRYARSFNPVNFDAREWTDLFADAGARYVVITSKHHDGFSIYRSKVSDYDMEITPYRADPLKMLADASAKRGLRLGFYHSIMDWHHPDYRPRREWETSDPKQGGNLPRYIDFMKEQIRELLTGYGKIAVMWFDGEWEHSTAEMRSDEVYDFIRRHSPETLVNDRLYKREPGNRPDFGTPEQFVPATGLKDPSGKPILWESCVTINADSWGYNKYETEFKTTRDLIRMLVEVVSKGGNLLLNVGPKPDGTIQNEFVTRLKAIGEWMKVNGDSIYGTTASPFARLPFFGRATAKGNTLYLHVFQWPAGGTLRVPGLKNAVRSVRLLADRSKMLPSRREAGDLVISLPEQAPDETASVIELMLDGPPAAAPYVARADKDGVIRLGAESCEIETRFEQRAKKENALGHVFLTRWTRADDIPTWKFQPARPGRYRVEISYAADRRMAGSDFEVIAGKARTASKTMDTGGTWVFKSFPAGEIELASGEQTLEVKAAVRGGIEAMNFEKLTLRPVN